MNPFKHLMVVMLGFCVVLILALLWITQFGEPCSADRIEKAEADQADMAAALFLAICADASQVEKREDPSDKKNYERPIAAIGFWVEADSDTEE